MNLDSKVEIQVSPERIKELISINKVLAILVVILTFTCGYLFFQSENKFKNNQANYQIKLRENSQSATSSAVVQVNKSSVIQKSLMGSRYSKEIGDEPILNTELLSALWSAQGQITEWGERTVPSYRSRFPIELKILIRGVKGFDPGWYDFDAKNQKLTRDNQKPGEVLIPENMPTLIMAPALIVATTESQMMVDHMVWQESGGLSQNILISAAEMGLAVDLVPIQQLPTNTVSMIMGKTDKSLLWIMSIGKNVNTDITNVIR